MNSRHAQDEAVTAALKRYWGYDALRPLQVDSIRATLDGRDSVTVLATGGGKSLCFQVPPLVNDKLTLVVSPLISLMQDQVAALRLAGVPAAATHGNLSSHETAELRALARSASLRLLYIAPERLFTPSVLDWVSRQSIGAIAIDEAHCISQWGHDFRPEYARLGELRRSLPGVAVGAYTATATARVRRDIIEQLGLRDPAQIVGSFDRPNLTYRIVPRLDAVGQMVEAIERRRDSAAIVYCISRRDTELFADLLRRRGLDAAAYHAGLNADERSRVSRDFRDERLRVVCATVAFGMGIDRADVRCVIHAAMPKSVEHYQQETGRAGRDGLPAECLMLYSGADAQRWRRILRRGSAPAEGPPAAPNDAGVQLQLLDEMQRFCSGAHCRHAMLCRYFGQNYTPPAQAGGCGACDFCLGELHVVRDAQVIARKILSCVARCGSGFGAAHIAGVLRGSRSRMIRARGHHELSTHGILAELPRERIVDYINQLVDLGHLQRSSGEFQTLRLGSSAASIMRDELQARLVEPKVVDAGGQFSMDAPGTTPDQLSPREQGMFSVLRALRTQIAREKGVPPYVVLWDSTLQELCRVRPSSMERLAGVRGIAAMKAEQLGERFIQAIAAHCLEVGLAMDQTSRSPKVTPTPRSPARRSAGSEQAADCYARGMSVEQVMSVTGRARSTCYEYLEEFVRCEKPPSIKAWVDTATAKRVLVAAESVRASAPPGEATRLRPVFVALDGQVPYELIRLVVAHARAGDARPPTVPP